MARQFAVTWDYRCPFARNAHEALVKGLQDGRDWEVRFWPFSLDQVHVEEGQTPVWQRSLDEPHGMGGVRALLASDPGTPLLGHHRHELPVASLDVIPVEPLVQALRGELPDRLEHGVPRYPQELGTAHQAVIEQRGQAVGRVDAQVAVRVAHGIDRGQGGPPGEHGEPGEEPLFRVRQELVAPFDGSAEGSLTLGHVGRPGPKGKAASQVGQKLGRREQSELGGRELDGQRQPVEPGAQLRHRPGVLLGDLEVRPNGLGPVPEQRHGLVAQK